MDQSINIGKGFESWTIAVGVEARTEACGEPLPIKGSYTHRGKFYRHPLPSTYKEIELLEVLKYGMEWVFIDHEKFLKQVKDPLTPRYDLV